MLAAVSTWRHEFKMYVRHQHSTAPDDGDDDDDDNDASPTVFLQLGPSSRWREL